MITKFDVGKATAWHAVIRVVKALCNLMNHFIIWPSEHEMIDSANRIRKMYGFPNVVGAVDGYQIRIPAPKIDSQSYQPERVSCNTTASKFTMFFFLRM